ncbi:MAG: DUF3365 domain-containing protein [Planctomycetes bacterium]|nr:DUF3365 domain-containing protein [Planctomycetota bacterium]
MRAFVRRLSLVSLGCLAACGPPAWSPISADDPAQAARRERAAAARDQLAQTLIGELAAALAVGGPTKAIEVCRERAPAIAATVSAERRVRIGRTSQRLRNSANEVPPWARAHVAGSSTQPAFFVGPAQQLGALYPIQTQPLCLQCHGRGDELKAPVRDALRRLYPQDAATGFAIGDLRGWFWVEVP